MSRELIPALLLGCVEALLSSGFGMRAWAAHQASHTLPGAVETFTEELRKAIQVGGVCCACALGAGGFTSILQVAKPEWGNGAKACLAPLPFLFLWDVCYGRNH